MTITPTTFNIHQHSELRSKITSEQSLGMVKIPSGHFDMGSLEKDNEEPIHKVEISSFLMDIRPVTVGEFRKFVEATQRKPPSWDHILIDSPTDDHPIIYISWRDAMSYAEWVGKRLPTEAEWEYAAGGGISQLDFNSLDNINFYGQKRMTNVAGEYPPNGYGLYDMRGNVWEWCLDAYIKNAYNDCKRLNPIILPKSELDRKELMFTSLSRVIRGGSWNNYALATRISFRAHQSPQQFYDYNGFRCVMDTDR